MFKLRGSVHTLILLALSVAGAAVALSAQEYTPNALPVLLDRKQAAEMVLAQRTPEYPPIAKVNYIAGQVRLELTVDNRGKVTRSHVLAGDAILAEAALEATRHWLYRPLTTPSGPEGFRTTVRLKFNMAYRGIEQTPPRAERDFLQQVKPPQLVRPPEDPPSDDIVHLRLLVNDQGKVEDMAVSPVSSRQFEAAREAVQGWTFRPAHWGNLPVASYLEVDVPVSAPSTDRATANIGRVVARCGR